MNLGEITGAMGGILIMVFIVIAYWIPTIVAYARKVPHLGSIAIINGFLGWTFIGWIVALALAARSTDRL